VTSGGTHSAPHAQRNAKRSAVHIDPARAASLIELPTAFHPLLVAKLAHEQLRREQEEQKKLHENDWGPFRTAIGRRKLRLLDAILKAADARGHAICHNENALFGIWLVIDRERVDWGFRERYYYRPLRPTEPKRDPFQSGQKNVAEPSGYLVLSIKADYSTTQEVREKPGKLFETRIEEILQKFEAKAAHAAEKKKQWEESERARWERQKRRLRVRTLERREEERWSELCRMAADWKEANDMRAFVDLVAARMNELEKRPARADLWLKWAGWRIDTLDPSRRDAQAIYDDIVRNPLLRRGRRCPMVRHTTTPNLTNCDRRSVQASLIVGVFLQRRYISYGTRAWRNW
jgi:hypothetical protein